MSDQQPSQQRPKLIETTDEEAKTLLARALAQVPRLGEFGVEAPGKARKEFLEERENLNRRLVQIAACADWIKRQEIRTTYRDAQDSYVCKGRVERWFESRGESIYIPNGCFIAAAVGLGLKIRPTDTGKNPSFKISKKTAEAPLASPAEWTREPLEAE